MKRNTIYVLMFGYLGFSISVFAKLQFYNWQFYAITVPIIIVVVYHERNQKD